MAAAGGHVSSRDQLQQCLIKCLGCQQCYYTKTFTRCGPNSRVRCTRAFCITASSHCRFSATSRLSHFEHDGESSLKSGRSGDIKLQITLEGGLSARTHVSSSATWAAAALVELWWLRGCLVRGPEDGDFATLREKEVEEQTVCIVSGHRAV
jgi:hypothetical protein